MFLMTANESYQATMEVQKAALLSGKITVRWSQARAGFAIRSGRSPVDGTPVFCCEGDAWEWMLETHGIGKPAK